ncbi:indolethylamine N-methyltransferase-like [Portunus trituberculatus]|uniref:indolethylamine N-methyltransferase-like n=1 Tax=Portunus trituberculatus TaxID=210409 RepID=UPI001E1CCC89|nr:indolethylamine N-methyltransferase-like [Portunus trituberculatus]
MNDEGIATQDKRARDQYLRHFNPRNYRATYYASVDQDMEFFLQCYHHAFHAEPRLTRLGPAQRRLLEVGCGPVPVYSACASAFASSVTMSEFLPQNRREMEAWMEGKDEALDWSFFFNYLSSLSPHRSVKDIESQLRSRFTKIIPCDLTMDNPLTSPAHRASYDVIMTNLCLEFVASSKDAFNLMVGRLVSLLRPGGVLIMAGALMCTKYQLGGQTYHSVPLGEEDLRAAVSPHCQGDVTIRTLPRQGLLQEKPADHEGVFFLLTQRQQEGESEGREGKE